MRVVKAHPRLALVPATAGPNTSNVVHISGIPSKGRAEWRELMRRIVTNHCNGAPGNPGKR